jgi:broad specificity phosphatase PhoE
MPVASAGLPLPGERGELPGLRPIRRREWFRVLGASCGVAVTNGPLQAKNHDLRIYLARHGQSEANAAHIVAGWTDSPLTANGRQQAHDLSEALQGVHLDAIYSSTLSRSRDTAVIAAARRRIELVPELRERNSGRFERGSNDAEGYLKRRFAEDDDLDGGETPAQFLKRVDGAIAGIISRHPAGAISIVGHAGTNQKILQSLFNLRSEQANGIVQDYDEVYSVDLVSGRPLRLWKLIREKNLSDL